MQAATGRGELRHEEAHVTLAAIRERITATVGIGALAWDAALIGHPDCHEGIMLVTSGGESVDVLSGRKLYQRFLEEMKNVPFDPVGILGALRRKLTARLAVANDSK